MIPTTIRVRVTEYDLARSVSDPSIDPLARAISRMLKTSIEDVEVSKDMVYIWNEWDNPDQVYILDQDAVEYLTDWEQYQDGSWHERPETFEFNIIQRE